MEKRNVRSQTNDIPMIYCKKKKNLFDTIFISIYILETILEID